MSANSEYKIYVSNMKCGFNDRIVELYVIDEIKMHRCHHFLAMHLIVLAIDSSESTK